MAYALAGATRTDRHPGGRVVARADTGALSCLHPVRALQSGVAAPRDLGHADPAGPALGEIRAGLTRSAAGWTPYWTPSPPRTEHRSVRWTLHNGVGPSLAPAQAETRRGPRVVPAAGTRQPRGLEHDDPPLIWIASARPSSAASCRRTRASSAWRRSTSSMSIGAITWASVGPGDRHRRGAALATRRAGRW